MAHGLLKFFRSVLLGLAVSTAAVQAGESIVVASTTSTEQSGLFNFILPIFEKDSGVAVRVVALGTGQALDVGRRGDADVVLVHDRPAEDKFVADGYGVDRRDVMYNDFVVIGPAADPAGVKRARDASDAFARIGSQGATWISRGDRSGTHAAELRFWKAAGVDPRGQGWYKEAGAGMGPTLNMAAGLGAYTLSDRGTWASFRNRQDLGILFAGDPQLYNPYGVILVNPARHPHVKRAAALRFMDWLTSADGRRAIAAYKIGNEQLFYPLAR
ncbi:MAG TPA: substrate-binding domain-containing protein [Rhodocyclaceae bacterium]|nr:substrate-binding domain-containing protein [Rhodocyclaceae bacterium]HNE14973.1 substrate-binding domain-containing protein [Rhodocyclaceae bacterium]